MNDKQLKYKGTVVDFSEPGPDKVCLANIPEPEDGERTCAVCLMPVPRDRYEQHMQDVHGYETLNIYPADVEEDQ